MNINIKTTIFQDNRKEIIETNATGRFYLKEQASYLQYEEESAGGSIRTIVKLAEEEVLILRSGAVKMRMPLILNKEVKGSYELPFGQFETAAIAKKIKHSFDFESGAGYINLRYDFSLQGSHAGTYDLEISFQEDNNEYC
ncbi:MAG TPA: DUF1934 domain-containing protein [Bacillales bacterium]|nr:DUF1934 domain-containing protein [Bacillales bacterium]